MKTYILRAPKTVEPQTPPPKAARAPRLQPVPAVSPDALPGAPAPTRNGPVLFLGLDVHTDSMAVSLAPSDSPE